MKIEKNTGNRNVAIAPNAPFPSTRAEDVAELLTRCPAAKSTPLLEVSGIAGEARLWVKDERGRMGLGSFKALGASYVIAKHAAELETDPGPSTLSGRTYITASAGNHGLSVAAGARIFGASAIVCIADSVPESFAQRLSSLGAEVRRSGVDYAASMLAAETAATNEGHILLSDSSWENYTELPEILMEGYTQLASEAVDQLPEPPSHIFLQAGVGGMAGALAAYFRKAWGKEPKIVVVEPASAPALQASVKAGKAVVADGPESSMGRLDCKEPSLIALNGLARDADFFVTVTDAEVEERLADLKGAGLETSPSGGAGVALAMIPEARMELGIGDQSRILTVLSEGPA